MKKDFPTNDAIKIKVLLFWRKSIRKSFDYSLKVKYLSFAKCLILKIYFCFTTFHKNTNVS